jgi:hypothetical protein
VYFERSPKVTPYLNLLFLSSPHLQSIETDVVPVNIPPPTDANFNYFSTSETTFASLQLDPLEWHQEITITYAKNGPNTGLLR